MERSEIDQLLQKYWSGETSLTEEKILKQYFSSEQLNSDPLDQEWFASIVNFQSVKVNKSDFQIPEPPYYRMNKLYNMIIKTAAVLICVFGLFWYVYYNKKIQSQQELVLRKKAEADLLFMSQMINEADIELNQSETTILKLKK
jgi:hypothetical protein